MTHSAKKCEGGPFGFINIHSVAKFQKTGRGGPFGDIQKFSKERRTTPKKNTKGTF